MEYLGIAVATLAIFALVVLLLQKPKVYAVLYVRPQTGPARRYSVYQGTYIVGRFSDPNGNAFTVASRGRLVGTSGLCPDGTVYQGEGYFQSSRLVNGPKTKPDFEGEIIFTPQPFADEADRYPDLVTV